CFFFSSRRRHTRFSREWSSDVCSSDLREGEFAVQCGGHGDGGPRVIDVYRSDSSVSVRSRLNKDSLASRAGPAGEPVGPPPVNAHPATVEYGPMEKYGLASAPGVPAVPSVCPGPLMTFKPLYRISATDVPGSRTDSIAGELPLLNEE